MAITSASFYHIALEMSIPFSSSVQALRGVLIFHQPEAVVIRYFRTLFNPLGAGFSGAFDYNIFCSGGRHSPPSPLVSLRAAPFLTGGYSHGAFGYC